MRLLLCAHLLIVAASQAAAQGHKTPATELDAQQVSWIICLLQFFRPLSALS